jgi:exopolysaccharide biosynthesis polyprenyl glycosylphosphotransferase
MSSADGTAVSPNGLSHTGAEPVSALEVVRPAPVRRGERARSARRLSLERAAFDFLVIAVALVVSEVARDETRVSGGLIAVFIATALAMMAAKGAYAARLRVGVLDGTLVAVASTAVAAMTVIAVDTWFGSGGHDASRWLEMWVATAPALALGHAANNALTLRRRKRGALGAPTVIVGAGVVGQLTARRLLAHPDLGLRPVGFLDKEPRHAQGQAPLLPVLGASWDLEETVRTHGVECVLITFSSAPHDVMLSILDDCERLGVRTIVVPRLFERMPSRLEVAHTGGLPLIEMFPTGPHSIQFAVKYAVDRVAAALAILVLSPLMLAIAIAVRVSLGAPILYRQCRVGLDGKEFEMLKFRTMALGAEGVEAASFEPDADLAPGGVEGEDRRTRVGVILRRLSLDELAQLFNVVKGEMSLVGPRPERPEFVEYFGDHVRRYDARHRVRSGITGWAQIHRLRGKTSISDRVEWDNYYIENFSLWLDLKILVLTIAEVFRGAPE